jgi:hypothetical protein
VTVLDDHLEMLLSTNKICGVVGSGHQQFSMQYPHDFLKGPTKTMKKLNQNSQGSVVGIPNM